MGQPKGCTPWNKDMKKEEFESHYKNPDSYKIGLAKGRGWNRKKKGIDAGFSEERRNRISEQIKENHRKGLYKNLYDKHRKRTSNKDEMKKHSDRIKVLHKEGRYINRDFTGKRNQHFYLGSSQIKIKMRSGEEVRYATYLDSINEKWTYEAEYFTYSDGTHFKPDFYLPNRNEYHEVKSDFTLNLLLFRRLKQHIKEFPDKKVVIIVNLKPFDYSKFLELV